MKKTAETALQHEDDEEGVADSAASLGPDGGPAAAPGQDAVAVEGEADAFADEAWLDEELSDEELAALGEEDFNFDEISDEELEAELQKASEEAGESASDLAAALEAETGEQDFEFADDSAFFGEVDDGADAGGAVEPATLEQAARTDADAPPEQDAGAGAFEYEHEVAPTFAETETADTPPDEAAPHGAVEEESDASHALVASGGGAMVDAPDYASEAFGEDEHDHRPVPRISIHAFCETPAVTELLEKASIDRRLAKAHLTIHMGGISKAVDQFQTAATPNLIILETLADGSEIFAQLGDLAEVCDPTTKVIIIGQINDIILYRELIRQGVSEYIVRPQSPLQIIKTVADLYVDPAAPPIGRTVAFVGARGGAGSSTIAHNVGWCTAEEHESDTVILDLDLPFGTASLDFDQEASAGLVEALTSPERLDDVLLDRLLQKHTDHLSLFTAPSVLDRDYEVDDQAFETVLDVVRGSAPTIVVDVPHVWCSWSKRILTTADEIVITATPDLASFRNTKQLVDILSASRPNDAAPVLIINQFDQKTSAVQPAQFAEHVGIKPAAVFNWEPQLFGAAATNASPIIDVSPKSKTSQTFRELSAQLIGRHDASLTRSKFRLFDLFKMKR